MYTVCNVCNVCNVNTVCNVCNVNTVFNVGNVNTVCNVCNVNNIGKFSARTGPKCIVLSFKAKHCTQNGCWLASMDGNLFSPTAEAIFVWSRNEHLIIEPHKAGLNV